MQLQPIAMMLLAPIFLMLVPAYALEENGVIEMPYSDKVPAIDGRWTTSEEWTDASTTRVENGNRFMYLLVKHDRDYLYIMQDVVSDLNGKKSAVSQIYFDTDNNAGNVLDSNDFIFFIVHNDVLGEMQDPEARVGDSNGGWTLIDLPHGTLVQIAFNSINDPFESGRDHWIYEFRVPLSFLHKQDKYGFKIMNWETDRPGLFWPDGSSLVTPNSFGTIVDSKNQVTNPPIPVISVSKTSLNFGNQEISKSSSPQSVTVSNTGTGDLIVSSISVNGDYSVSDVKTPMTISPGSNINIPIKFTPITEGTRFGSVTIKSNDITHPSLTVTTSGTGMIKVQSDIDIDISLFSEYFDCMQNQEKTPPISPLLREPDRCILDNPMFLTIVGVAAGGGIGAGVYSKHRKKSKVNKQVKR